MKNILLIGAGRFGRHIAVQLSQLGHQVMAVDTNEERINDVLPYVTNAQIGDSTNAEFLRSLGIGNFDVCIVTISGNFQNSLETTSLLKELGAKCVVSRAERDVQAKFLLRNGADHVVYPEKQVAKWALIVTVLPQKKAQRLLSIASLTNQTFTNFVSGQLTEAVIIGVLCFFGMLILGIPYAGAVSAFVAVTALVPIFGAWIGGGLGAFLILLAEPGKALWFILFLLVLQQVEGNLIYPKVVGKSVGLPGLLVLMAVTIGGEAFGVLGMLFSAILSKSQYPQIVMSPLFRKRGHFSLILKKRQRKPALITLN